MSDYISDIVRDVINRHIDKNDCSESMYNLRVGLFNEFDRLLRLKHLHSKDNDTDYHLNAIASHAISIAEIENIEGSFDVSVTGYATNEDVVIETQTIGRETK